MTPEELKAAREALGVSQAKLAPMLGMSRPMTISDWERGTKPIPETAALLIQALVAGFRPGTESAREPRFLMKNDAVAAAGFLRGVAARFDSGEPERLRLMNVAAVLEEADQVQIGGEA